MNELPTLEYRLRLRIDELSDRAEKLETKLERVRKRNKINRTRALDARDSRDSWKSIATGMKYERAVTRPHRICKGCRRDWSEHTPGCRQCTFRHSTRKRRKTAALQEERG